VSIKKIRILLKLHGKDLILLKYKSLAEYRSENNFIEPSKSLGMFKLIARVSKLFDILLIMLEISIIFYFDT